VEKYSDPPIVNLATLGLYHEMSDRLPFQKINFLSMTFGREGDKERFDDAVMRLQRSYRERLDQYEREKIEIRYSGKLRSPRISQT
jgi:hypothetical protein